jgi:hypothetical protein
MLMFDWDGWTEWTPLTALDLSTDRSPVPKKPGAYVVATDRPVSRAVGTDTEGFLDVGESGKLRDRLWGFQECVTNRGAEWHRAGWRFAFFRFERHFPVSSLRVRWRATDTKSEAYRLEGQLLLVYLTRHGELPPLNYKFNWDSFEELGWNIFDEPATDK